MPHPVNQGRHLPRSEKSKPSVRDLISRIKKGDDEATKRFLGIVQPMLVLYIAARMGARLRRVEQVEDVLQNVFLEFFPNIGKLPDDADKAVVLRRLRIIAKSRMIDTARKYRDYFGESSIPADMRDPAHDEPSCGPVTTMDCYAKINALVEKLPWTDAEIVRIVVVEGSSFVEAGTRLEMHPDTVRKRVQRVLRKLIASIQD